MDEFFNNENILSLTKTLGNKFFWINHELITEAIFDARCEILANEKKYKKLELFLLKKLIYKIARNNLVNFIKSQQMHLKYKNQIIQKFIKTEYDEDLEILQDKYYNQITKDTDVFSTPELEILEWHYFTGLKFKEISTLKNKSEGAIKTEHFRLINKIRKIFPNPN